jgi:hypothetical protein
MIAYDLQCGNGHTFEGWFEDSKAFLGQKKKGLISCPICNDTQILRLPSTFAIKNAPAAVKPKEADPRDETMWAQFGKQLVEFVDKNFDDVGCDFSKEALKIHYGATEPRNIRGVSTQAEEKTLQQEGVQFFKIPMPAPPETDS